MSARVLVLDLSTTARFWSKVDRRGPGDCWEWQGSRQKYGHGLLSVGGKNLKAHRISYQINVAPIPEGLLVRHRCDNPPCVNPAHLEVGTPADNARDRDSRGRHWALSGEEHNMAKLTPDAVREIRAFPRYAPGFARDLAEKYGISLSHVYQLRSTKPLWKDVVA